MVLFSASDNIHPVPFPLVLFSLKPHSPSFIIMATRAFLHTKGKGKGKGRDLACDTPAPPAEQATPPATPLVEKEEEAEWRSLCDGWASKLSFGAKSLENLTTGNWDPADQKAIDMARE